MDNNPLKQYFRRPSVYMKLPSGGLGYPEGAIDMPENGELPVYPMTAIDDITARTPDALYNGIAVVELIKSCIPNIKDPWAVTNVDLDAVLLSIKTASSSSGEMDVDSQCPKCEDIASYKINLANMLGTLKPVDFNKELEIGDLSIRFKPIPFRDINAASTEQFQLQNIFVQAESVEDEDEKARLLQTGLKRITELTMELLSKSIEHIVTPTTTVTDSEFILDFLKHCDRNVYLDIRNYSAKLREDSELKPMKIECTACGNEYEQTITLNPTDFFD